MSRIEKGDAADPGRAAGAVSIRGSVAGGGTGGGTGGAGAGGRPKSERRVMVRRPGC